MKEMKGKEQEEMTYGALRDSAALDRKCGEERQQTWGIERQCST